MYLFLGFIIMYGVHKIPYRYFKGLSLVLVPVVIVLLILTMLQGTTIDGANASRWIQIPIVNMSFQTSTFAFVVLMVFVAKYMSKIKDEDVSFKDTILPLWAPVFIVLVLILPANFSTAAIMFVMVLMLVFLGGYPIRYLAVIIGAGILALTLFVLIAKAFPDAMPNRVDTWMSRIENFSSDGDSEADYQIEKAKIAIATGGIQGVGPGKSIQENFLPQSSSDFIYAIIVEEYGLIGGLVLMIFYLWLLFRIVIVSQKADTIFGKLLVLGVCLAIVIQGFINMGVGGKIFPFKGQNLPLNSNGGNSNLIACMGLGIILNVNSKREEKKKPEGKEEHPLEILSEAI